MKVYNIYQVCEDNYKNHQMLKEIFPGSGKLLHHRMSSHIIVCTECDLAPQFEHDIRVSYECELDELLQRSENVPFAIRLNCVKRSGRRVTPLVGEAAEEWARAKLNEIGAKIKDISFRHEGVIPCRKGSKILHHASILCTGLLDVDDREKLISHMASGIGRGKAFGFGFLLLS